MLIKCPQCSTGYNVPEDQMLQKARKMRCHRCKTVFTVAKRSASLPPGYEEFAGAKQSALPDEFAFLRHTQTNIDFHEDAKQEQKGRPYEETILEVNRHAADLAERDSDADPHSTREPGASSGHTNPGIPIRDILPPKPSPVQPPQEESIVDKVLREAREKKAASLTREQSSPESARAKSPALGESPTILAPKSDGTPSRHSPETSEPRIRAEALQPEFNGSNTQAWEMEAPLELERFEVGSGSRTAQIIGKLTTVLILAVVSFFVFVAYRNGWSLSYDQIGRQVSLAFSHKWAEKPPKGAESLEVTVDERRMLSRKNGEPLLIVTGKVFNNDQLSRSNIILRGRLLDSQGEIRSKTRFPCDKIIEDAKLAEAGKGAIADFFNKEGALYNCSILGESNTFYQLVFEDIPSDYDESFTVEVHPIHVKSEE